MLKATVSGSFHRHMVGIYEAVGELRGRGLDVLSPSDPRVVDHIGDFLFVASDKLRSVRLVQDRHFAAIRASDFLWVVCPDGYTGASTCLEIATANAFGIPTFSIAPASDITVSEYVQPVSNIEDAILRVRDRPAKYRTSDSVLLDPEGGIDACMRVLEDLRPSLLGRRGDGRIDAELRYERAKKTVKGSFAI